MMYDIGLICVFNSNYGNNITNFALFRFLKNCGYRTLLIKQPLTCFWTDKVRGDFGLFRANPFEADEVDETRIYSFQYYKLNDKCVKYVLGSDQLWSYGFVLGTDYYTCANWTISTTPRIAYGTSFGTDRYDGNDMETQLLGEYLARFNQIFVREESGVDYLKNQFDIYSRHVCDPIFFLKAQEYGKLLKLKCSNHGNKIIGAYILDYSSNVSKSISTACKELNCDEAFLIGNPANDERISCDPPIRYFENAKVEDLIELISRCEYFITDSYHGMCLALIFHKQFQIFAKKDSKRGYPRIYSLLKKLNSLERIIENDEITRTKQIIGMKIDYSKICSVLDGWIEECKESLLLAVNSSDVRADYLYDDELKKRFDSSTFELQRSKERVKDKWIEYCLDKKICESTVPLVWGCGDCFKKNAFVFKDALSINTVVDSNRNLWNKTIYDSFRCISPSDVSEDSVVIVLIDNMNVVEDIQRLSEDAGIKYVVHYKFFMDE